MIKIIPLTIVSTLILSACAGVVAVHSRPEGALISANNQSLGISPVLIPLDSEGALSFQKSGEGCYEHPLFTVHWASGAVATSPTSLMCRDRNGNYKIIIQRPAHVPDLKKDLNAAKTPEAVMARRRAYMMKYHPDRSNPSDNNDPDMTDGYVSVDEIEDAGRLWEDRGSTVIMSR